MSLFGKLFGGGGKGGKAPTPQEAVQRLRETEEMLAKKQDFLEKKIDHELMTAKKNGTKNKRGEEKASELVWFDGSVKPIVSLWVSSQANWGEGTGKLGVDSLMLPEQGDSIFKWLFFFFFKGNTLFKLTEGGKK